jgi:hypothetical protein
MIYNFKQFNESKDRITVEITNSNTNTWYSGLVGSQFYVFDAGDRYILDDNSGSWINKDDCEVVD